MSSSSTTPARSPKLRRAARRTAAVLLAAPLVGGLLATTADAATGDPFGNGFDKVTGVTGGVEVKGWAIDPDTTAPIKVRVTVDGVAKDVTADVARADIGSAYPAYGPNHGFLTTVSATPGTHQVCVTALNVGAGANTSFDCQQVTVPGTTSSSTTTTTSTPSASTTGVPSGKTLTAYNGTLTITTPGTVVDGLDVSGTIIVKADNVTIKNTRVRGITSNTYTTPLIYAQNGNKNLVVQDSELIPSSPNQYQFGIIGWNFTLDRVEIAKVVDGVHIIGSNTVVRNSYIHDVRHYTVNGSITHSDGIQIQVGSNHRVTNNRIEGGYNAAIQVTQDRGDTSNLQITGNWMSNGLCSVNIAEKSYGPLSGVTVSSNTFGRGQRSQDCAIVRPTTTTLTATGNVFTDGEVVKLRNG
jgi:hypothetical protein